MASCVTPEIIKYADCMLIIVALANDSGLYRIPQNAMIAEENGEEKESKRNATTPSNRSPLHQEDRRLLVIVVG